MSATASKIRNFLLVQPKPAFVRVTGDGEAQVLKVGRSYAKLADTIEALDIDLVEALDKDNAILRAMRLSSAEAQRSPAAEAPELLKADPETARLTHFANLLHRAYEFSTETAFARLVEVFDRVNERSDSIERRLERQEATNRRLLQDQVDDALDRAEEAAEKAQQEAGGEGGDLLQQMGSAFLAGRAQQQTKNPTNGKGGH